MSRERNCFGLEPSVAPGCRYLVLGSMPGVESLRQQRYYAHPRNRFWPLMFTLLTGSGEVPEDYQARLSVLLAHGVALWDAIGACERQGSLDTAIHDVQGNDFAAFLQEYPSIKVICCNGAKSYQTFCRFNGQLLKREGLSVYSLPSTSPANARWTLPMLLEEWGRAFASLPS